MMTDISSHLHTKLRESVVAIVAEKIDFGKVVTGADEPLCNQAHSRIKQNTCLVPSTASDSTHIREKNQSISRKFDHVCSTSMDSLDNTSWLCSVFIHVVRL